MPYTAEDLNSWFWELLGLGPSKSYRAKYNNLSEKQQKEYRKRKAARIYSKEDRAALTKRGFVKGQIHVGVNILMVRRKEKGLGTYSSSRFVVNQKEKFAGLFEENYSELAEISGTQKKLPLERDERGRFLKRR